MMGATAEPYAERELTREGQNPETGYPQRAKIKPTMTDKTKKSK